LLKELVLREAQLNMFVRRKIGGKFGVKKDI
jgi:hypothetical protein